MKDALGHGSDVRGTGTHAQGIEAIGHEPAIEQIPISLLGHEIYDDDPRRLTALRTDVAARGFTSPLELLEHKGHLSVQDGKHRLEVARQLGLSHVPAKVWHL
jgi:ParB-like chromosome segregation protein Spo0J